MITAMKVGLLSGIALVVVVASAAAGAQATAARLEVPFVGCAADGQTGPVKAPKPHPVRLAIAPAIAARLAYYKAEDGPGVLAPRGWHCFSTYGSNGSSLYLSPDPISGQQLLSSAWKGFSGDAVQVSQSVGDTSGRFEVARAIGRVFPDRKDYVQDIISEGIEPASAFPAGPYPTDKLQRRGKDVVEFETPPNAKGLGTDSRLVPNASPIRGVLMLFGEEPNLIHASIRLANADLDLVPLILKQLEDEVSRRQE